MCSSFFHDGFDSLDLRDFSPYRAQTSTMLVPDLLPLGEPGMLVGDPGSGKTEVGLTLAVGITLGVSVLGLPITEAKPVVYMAFEGSPGSLGSRVDRICHQVVPEFSGDEAELLHENLHLLIPSLHRPIHGPDRYEAILKNVRRLSDQVSSPGLLVVDTMSHLIDGDENQAASAREPWRMAQAISNGCGWTVLMIHHMRKALQGAGLPYHRRGVSDIRGTSAHGASARFVLELTARKTSKAMASPGGHLELRVIKRNDGPEGFSMVVSRHPETGGLSRQEEVKVSPGVPPSTGFGERTKTARVFEIYRDNRLSEEEARKRALTVFSDSENPPASLRSCLRRLKQKNLMP